MREAQVDTKRIHQGGASGRSGPNVSRNVPEAPLDSRWQTSLLRRLDRLTRLRQQVKQPPVQDPFISTLLDRGIFATYRECLEAGAKVEARTTIRRLDWQPSAQRAGAGQR